MTGQQEPPRTLQDQDALDLAAERLAQVGRARRRQAQVDAMGMAERVDQRQRPAATPPAGLPTFEDIAPSYPPMTFSPGSPRYGWDPDTGGMVRPVPPVARTHDEVTARAGRPVPPLERYGSGRVQEVPPPPAPAPAPRAPRAVNLDMAERLGAAYAAALAERIALQRTLDMMPPGSLHRPGLQQGVAAVESIIRTLDGE